MTTIRLAIGMTQVKSAKPNYAYGSAIAQQNVRDALALVLMRASIPTSIPRNAVVTSAIMWINQYDGPWSGAVTLTAMRHLAAFKWNVTWNTKPAATGAASQTKTGSGGGSWWNLDVTADVQAIVSGTRPNYGWRLKSSSGTAHKVRSHRAARNQPYMLLTYVIPAKVPTNLAPAGAAVGIDKPTLSFTVGSDTTAFQVQVDPASDSVTPDFDSGEVAGTHGLLDLADTAYTGLADGSTTYWRARAKNSYGWSSWSAWVSFSRDDLDPVTLDAPTTTPADVSPPFLWTFTGTQTAWQATLMDVDRKVLADSGVVSGDDTGWTPAAGLTAPGQSGIARIRVWDDVLRVATQGVPAYSEDEVEFTVVFDGTVDPMDTLTATTVPNKPGVLLEGTRAAGIPDEVIIFRDGIQVGRVEGVDMFTTATDFAWTDWTAPLGQEVTYTLAPVVNAAVALGGPTDTATPRAQGLWLIDPDSATTAVLWGANEGSFDATDVATVHVTVSDDAPVVRRRLKRGVLTGTESGVIIDVDELLGADTIVALETFKANDAGHVYRLIDGHLNLEVIVGDILIAPTPESTPERQLAKAQFNFWTA